jgi:hypothetical protein
MSSQPALSDLHSSISERQLSNMNENNQPT